MREPLCYIANFVKMLIFTTWGPTWPSVLTKKKLKVLFFLICKIPSETMHGLLNNAVHELCNEQEEHSMAIANLNKSEELVTNTTAASKFTY